MWTVEAYLAEPQRVSREVSAEQHAPFLQTQPPLLARRTMRRSQTSRPTHRPSQSSSLGGSAEFGFLRDASLRNGRPTIDQDLSRPDSAASSTRRRPRETTASPFDLSIKHEADEQEGEMTIEAHLRRDLREAQKEIERASHMAE